MSSAKYMCVCAIVACAATVAVVGRPSHRHRTLVLEQVANMSVCPIEVTIDDVPERIPRRIKFIKCAETPNQLCTKHNMSHGCCKKHHHDTRDSTRRSYMTECVEIHDWVQVSYKNNPKMSQVLVPVGCSCVIQETTTVPEVQ